MVKDVWLYPNKLDHFISAFFLHVFFHVWESFLDTKSGIRYFFTLDTSIPTRYSIGEDQLPT